MTVKQLRNEMDGSEIEMWFALYEIEAEERKVPKSPGPFTPSRRTIGGH